MADVLVRNRACYWICGGNDMVDVQRLVESYPDVGFTLIDGFDDCIIGVCEMIACNPIIAYDMEKVIEKNVSQGMTREEAEEFFQYSQIGAFMGDNTPCFINLGEEK